MPSHYNNAISCVSFWSQYENFVWSKNKKKAKKEGKKLIHGKFEELISKLQCKTTDLEKSP